MHNLKAILAALSLTCLSSCLVGDFDDLQDKVYVESHGKGNLDVNSFAAGLIGTGGADGMSYYVVSLDPPTLLHVNFAQDGSRSTGKAIPIPPTFAGTTKLRDFPTVASDTVSFATSGQERVALGILDSGQAKVIMLNAFFDALADPFTTAQFALAGEQEPSAIAFGDSGASAAGSIDVAAVAGSQLNLVADYQSEPTSSFACDLSPKTPGGLALANVDTVADDAEILVAADDTILITSASAIEQDTGSACSAASAEISAPAGISDFGDILATGDFDGNDQVDIVAAAGASNAVFVYMNWTVQNPTPAIRIPTPVGSVEFGNTLAIGDFDADDKDEIVIGDPKYKTPAHPSAGRVYIFSTAGAGDFELQATLHDSSAEDNQNFGRALAVTQAFGRDKLVISTANEVFSYFQTPLIGDEDFRVSN